MTPYSGDFVPALIQSITASKASLLESYDSFEACIFTLTKASSHPDILLQLWAGNHIQNECKPFKQALTDLIPHLTESKHRVLFVKFVIEWVDKIYEKSQQNTTEEAE